MFVLNSAYELNHGNLFDSQGIVICLKVKSCKPALIPK